MIAQDEEGNSSTDTSSTVTSGDWPADLTTRRKGPALGVFLGVTKASSSCETLSNVSPSFTGALEMLRRHSTDLNLAIRLIHMYPNLIHDQSVDGLWEFIQPFLTRDNLDKPGPYSQVGLQGDMSDGSVTDSSASGFWGETEDLPQSSAGTSRLFGCHTGTDGQQTSASGDTKCVCICFNIQSSNTGQQNSGIVDAVLRFLLPHVLVTCSYPGPSSDKAPCQAMVFILTDDTLTDTRCLDCLAKATTDGVPVIMVREQTFIMPCPLPKIITKKDPARLKIPPPGNSGRESNETVLPSEGSQQIVNYFTAISPHKPGQDTSAQKTPSSPDPVSRLMSLSDIIHNGFWKSLVYVQECPENCMKQLHHRLAAYVGDGVLLDRDSTGAERSSTKIPSKSGRDKPISETDILYNTGYIPRGPPGVISLYPPLTSPPNRRLWARKGKSYFNTTISDLDSGGRVTPPETGTATRCSPGQVLLPPIHTPSNPPRLRKFHSYEPPEPEFEERETAYLLLRKPGSEPELVTWPLKQQLRDRTHSPDSGDIFSLDSDSECALTIQISAKDIDLRSYSTTPELL